MNDETKHLRYMNHLVILAILLTFVGMVLIFVGAIMSGGEVSAGGVLLIGPIPIILGAGPLGQLLALLATVITIVLLALMFFCARRFSRSKTEPAQA